MKRFLIYYNYELKEPRNELIVVAVKDTLEVEAESRKTIDTVKIKEQLRKIALDSRTDSNLYIYHCNYYRIEELDENNNIIEESGE